MFGTVFSTVFTHAVAATAISVLKESKEDERQYRSHGSNKGFSPPSRRTPSPPCSKASSSGCPSTSSMSKKKLIMCEVPIKDRDNGSSDKERLRQYGSHGSNKGISPPPPYRKASSSGCPSTSFMSKKKLIKCEVPIKDGDNGRGIRKPLQSSDVNEIVRITAKVSNSRSNSTQTLHKFKTCEDGPSVTIYPCKHSSCCTECFTKHLDSHDGCPDCKSDIDKCFPLSKAQGKCKDCRKFSNLMLVQPCGHASVCPKCFDKRLVSSGSCPDCGKQIESCQPHSSARGECKVCNKFSLLMQFLPCGHYSFCEEHARMYLDQSNWKCFECVKRISKIGIPSDQGNAESKLFGMSNSC